MLASCLYFYFVFFMSPCERLKRAMPSSPAKVYTDAEVEAVSTTIPATTPICPVGEEPLDELDMKANMDRRERA